MAGATARISILAVVGLYALAQAAPPPASLPATHRTNNLTAEGTLSTGTLFVQFGKGEPKIPLVEGHGSYFEKDVTLLDPVTRQEFSHADSVLEIIDAAVNSAVYECTNLAASWGGDSAKLAKKENVCGTSDFLVKVWPTAKNQAKAASCYCVAKETYRLRGASPEKVKAFPRPGLNQSLTMIPMSPDLTVLRPDGSRVEADRLTDVFAQDLGPGPVDTDTGTRMRYMRLFGKNSRGEFVPLSDTQDNIYRVVDSGLVQSDIPATKLVAREALSRYDGSKVSVDRVSPDMWLRPKYLDPLTGGQSLMGHILNSGKNGEQTLLSDDLYAMPTDLNAQTFGLMSRLRSKEKWQTHQRGNVAQTPSENQILKVDGIPRPAFSRDISAALPVVNDFKKAKRTGYYNYSYDDDHVWGRPHVIWNIQEAGRRLAQKNIIMGIGDINRKPGRNEPAHYAETAPHATHDHGLCVDMRLISNAGYAFQGTVNDAAYSEDKTFEMIKTYIDVDSNIESIYVNDEALLNRVRAYLRQKGIRGAKVQQVSGHHNHVHIGYKS